MLKFVKNIPQINTTEELKRIVYFTSFKPALESLVNIRCKVPVCVTCKDWVLDLSLQKRDNWEAFFGHQTVAIKFILYFPFSYIPIVEGVVIICRNVIC